MDLTRLAVDAGQLINRAVQYTGEALGQAEKTEFDNRLEELLARAESTKTWTDQIISQTEVLLQPSPGARLEDRLYEHLDWSAPPRPRVHEVLGDNMSQAGLELGPNTPYGTALLRCGETQKQIGEAERKFVQSTNIHFLTPLRSFTEGEYRVIQDERRTLLNKRLDLDIAKTRLRKAHEADAEARSLNANPLDDNYVAHVSYMFSFLRVKWLKIWAQEISQAEMELRICQSLFDRQSEITRQLLEGLSTTHTNHMRSLTDFVEAQTCYFAQCHQHAQELQKQLASIPAVLCANNWQSGITNAINQPSISSHIANDPIGLNQVTPAPVIIHQLPGFKQAPPTANPLSGTENASATTQLPDQTNINNNNNTSLADSQAPSWSSATNGQTSQSFTTKRSSGSWPPAVTQAADQIFTSHSDSPSSATHPANQRPTPSRTVSALLTTRGGAVEPPASGGTGSQPTTNGATSPPSQLSGIVSKPQAANDTARETQETNIMTSKTQTTNGTASETQTANSKTGKTQQTNGTVSEIQRTSSSTSEATSDTANETQTTSSTSNEIQKTNDSTNETHRINDTVVNDAQPISNTSNETQETHDTVSEMQTISRTVNETHTTKDTANENQTTSSRANKTQTTNDTANEIQTTNSTANETHTTNDTVHETQTISSRANETRTTNGTVSMTETTIGTASENLTTNGSASETLATSEAAAEPPATN